MGADMRRGPVDSGWAGSLFVKPIEQSKPVLTPLQFPAAVEPVKKPIAVLLDGKWYSAGKEISEVEAHTGNPCDGISACIIIADPTGKAYDSKYPCRCFHCKGNQGPCGSKCTLYPQRTTGGKYGGCSMVQHKAKSRAEVELGVSS